MKYLRVPWISNANISTPLSSLAKRLKEGKPDYIAEINWKSWPYAPDTKFWTGWSDEEIILHYNVSEKSVKTVFSMTNAPVCMDSCVEFFISAGGYEYFNFEFNASGTRFAGYGKNRKTSKKLDPKYVEQIRCEASLGYLPIEIPGIETKWSLTIGIPFKLFENMPLQNPSDRVFKGNFYKCAEHTEAPHFVTWNKIETENPDFHQPAFFGDIHFERRQS